MTNRPPQKVTVEDLLRLKRTERPSAEFWAGFERELRAKQLAALVSRRPWWDVSWARVRAGLVRVVAPLGAAAALAFAFVAFNENQPAAPAMRPPVVGALTSVSLAAGAPAQLAVPTPGPATAVADLVPAPQPAVATAAKVENSPPDSAAAIAGPATPWTVGIVSAAATALALETSPVASFDSLTAPALISGLDGPAFASAPSNSVEPAKAASGAVSPLTLQLLAAARPAAKAAERAGEKDAQVRESVIRSLPEDLLYTSARRIVGLDGSSVNVRF